MALVNAKNGQMLVAAALALGGLANHGLNTLRAKAQARGLKHEFEPEFE